MIALFLGCFGSFLLGHGTRWFYSLMDGPWVKYPEGSGWSGGKEHLDLP